MSNENKTQKGLNYAILVDLENAGGKVHTMNTIIEKVKIRGNILLGKVYGYTDAFSSLKEVLLSNTFQVVPSIKFGHSQKNNLDIQLVIDALDIAFNNELIDCFCIVSGDSDYTPLVGKLKSMGKFVLGISRSEVASKMFINACNEFIFLESMADPVKVRKKKREQEPDDAAGGDLSELNELIMTIIEDSDEDFINASSLKNTIVRLRPDFDEKAYGANSFSKLLNMAADRFGTIKVETANFIVTVSAVESKPVQSPLRQINKENFADVIMDILEKLKSEGFLRVNPSVIKQYVTLEYPGFDEKKLGFRKFSDLIKQLEQKNLVTIESDEQHTMLVKRK
ncbi:MAG: NYN domain-containing protein [Clostridia bacterium]|nr:NYN domain-containing protein [Clostridia bacterium]